MRATRRKTQTRSETLFIERDTIAGKSCDEDDSGGEDENKNKQDGK